MKPAELVGAAILLTLGLLVTAASGGDVFDLEKKIEGYVQSKAQQHGARVLQWDITGNLRPEYKLFFLDIIGAHAVYPEGQNEGTRSKLNFRGGAIQYGKVSTTRNVTRVLHTEYVDAWPERVVTTLEKSIVHTRKSSWHSQISTGHGCKVSVTAGLPLGWSANAEYHREITLTNGKAGEYTESQTLSVSQKIPIPPMTRTKIQWIAIDEVQEIPWTADVTAEGNFGVVFDKSIDNKKKHVERITVLQDPLLTKINDQTVRYTTKGVFLGVKTIGNRLHLARMDPESYSRKGPSLTVIDLPLH